MRRLGYRNLEEATAVDEDGPFVSFTDLFVGILFLFLILVAALMLMQQASVQTARHEAISYANDMGQLGLLHAEVKQLSAKLDEIARQDKEHPPFRLVIAYNEYHSDNLTTEDNSAPLNFLQSVRVLMNPFGDCIYEIFLANGVTTVGQVRDEQIPRADNPSSFRSLAKCDLTSAGRQTDGENTKFSMRRVAENLYEGFVTIHDKDETTGHVTDIIQREQYRILGIYDDDFKKW